MPKNIVICSDGTGNTSIKGRGTNVFKLFEAVEVRENQDDPTKDRQIVIYDDGVGSQDFKPLKILGGAFGYGLSRNVKQLYRELARNYEPGDRIYLFGFSRGAFTVRVLSGLIAHVGIVDACPGKVNSDGELEDRVDEAYETLRKCFRRFSKWRKTPVYEAPALEFRRKYSHECPHVHQQKSGNERLVEGSYPGAGGEGVSPTACTACKQPIEFIGVWDTVDAVGFPVDEIADLWHNVVYPFRFPDHNLSSCVKWARHAISIDDERRTFHPELWNENDETRASGRIRQVWFAGVHSNVGGGYEKHGMSLVPLVWMMKEAEARELRFVKSMRELYTELQNVTDKLYDSRAGLGGYYGYKPRNIAELCAKAGAKPVLHISAVERIAVGTEGYAPGNIPHDDVSIEADKDGADTQPLADIIKKNFNTNGTRLASAPTWINLWRWGQALFVVASLALVGAYLNEYGWGAFSGLSSASGYVRIAEFLRTKPYLGVPLIAALVVTYGLCYLSDSKLRRMYSEFWFCARKEMQEVLFPKAKGAGA